MVNRRRGSSRWPAAGLLLVVLLPSSALAQKFRRDDPLLRDPDDRPIPKPAPIELATAYDVIERTFRHRPKGEPPPAVNVNTLGEVPDSTWFTNRIGVREMSVAEIARGPNTIAGPVKPWKVVRGKSSGITPGFIVQDATGEIYFLKFDPVKYPRLSTSAELLGTKFFHAIGYNVPETFLVTFRRSEVSVAPSARFSRGSVKRPMNELDIDDLLANVLLRPDGTYLAVAGRKIPGDVVGPHEFHGVRGDDPNDVFPHEHRRDLRGYRVFCAWLNHDDSRSVNTLDTWVGEGGRGHLVHYLQDFSSAFGSGSDPQRHIVPQGLRSGNEYIIDGKPILMALFTLGLWDRPWRKVSYEVYPEVGRIEGTFFSPEKWKPEYPNPAFERMRPADGFWAARIVARFSDEAVRAIVRTGEFEDPVAEEHLADVLLQRRDKVVAHYFRILNPLDGFRLEGDRLLFDNLGEKAGLASAEGYQYEWSVYDNTTGRTTPLGEPGRTVSPSVPVPAADAEYVMVRLRTPSASVPDWRKAVDVYLRLAPSRLVVGIDREE
jgi:hypothetical protein